MLSDSVWFISSTRYSSINGKNDEEIELSGCWCCFYCYYRRTGFVIYISSLTIGAALLDFCKLFFELFEMSEMPLRRLPSKLFVSLFRVFGVYTVKDSLFILDVELPVCYFTSVKLFICIYSWRLD